MTLEALAMLIEVSGPIRIVEWNDDMYEFETLYEFHKIGWYDEPSFITVVNDHDIGDRIVKSICADFHTEDMDEPAALSIEVKAL